MVTIKVKYVVDTIDVYQPLNCVISLYTYVVALDVNSYQLCLQCSPYHIEDKVLIMGDAAHAMLPFLAQGVNSVCVKHNLC